LLSDQPHSLALEDKANRLGLNLQQSQRVMLVRPPDGVLPSLRLVDKLAPDVWHYTRQSIVQPFGANLILIIPDDVDARALGQKLMNTMSGLKIGVGNIAPALTDLAESHRQAKEALEIGVALSAPESLFFFEDLGYLHWLYHQPLAKKNGNRFAKQIRRLVTEERAERAQLLRTLDAFLDLGGNAAETARVLKIHRNTLSYRLKQIENYCEVSLSDPVTRINLQIAIKAYQLSQIQEEA
jgi:purine catabolism regulator